MINKRIISVALLVFLLTQFFSGEEISASEPPTNALEQLIEKGREFSKRRYKKILSLKPDLATSWYNVSLSFAVMGKKEDLFYCLQRAIALEPRYREEVKKNPYFQAYNDEKKFRAIMGE